MTRIKKPHEGIRGNKKPAQFGYCPYCGSDALVKDGFTTNEGNKKQRYECKSCEKRTSAPAKEPPTLKMQMRKNVPSVKRYIVTSAQNATPVHRATWQSILNCAEYYDAEIVVIPGRYKNPTSQWTQKNKDHEWWDKLVVPYLCDGWVLLNDRLVILGDVKVQWAARQPLVGLDSLTKDKSGIVGHGSRALRSIATPQHKHSKLMMTTGTVTVRNYTDTKQGMLGKFSHCLGGLIVEIDGDTFYARQLNATKKGHFIDLDREFTPNGVSVAKPALALSMGDTHFRWIDPGVVRATFTSPDSMLKVLKPRNLMWHDVIDFHSRNWHHRDDFLTEYGKEKFNISDIEAEIKEGVMFVNKHTPVYCESRIVSSNHERQIGRWLRDTDPRKDPRNLLIWLRMTAEATNNLKKTAGGICYDDPFIKEAMPYAKPNVKFLKLGQSFVISGVEYGFHGDIGPDGARGTTRNLSKLGVKVTKGHSHKAEIDGGCYSAGKSTGPLEYEHGGPSSHSNTHVVQYHNGKRSLITIINGKYCLPRPKKPITKKNEPLDAQVVDTDNIDEISEGN